VLNTGGKFVPIHVMTAYFGLAV